MKRDRQLFYDLKNQILMKNYAEVDLNISQETYEKAAQLFIDFTKLDKNYNSPFKFKTPPYKRGKVGYSLEKISEGSIDNKEYFHYSPHFEYMFKDEIENCNHDLTNEMLSTMKYIHSTSMDKSTQIIKALNSEHPGLLSKFFPKDKLPLFVLRILKYHPQNKNKFLAKAHYDRGIYTLALAESSPGLRLGTNDTNLQEVTHNSGKVFFMPGINLHKLTSKEFAPVWHDVVQNEKNIFDEQTARWAIVFFTNIHELNENVSWDQAHTPINY